MRGEIAMTRQEASEYVATQIPKQMAELMGIPDQADEMGVVLIVLVPGTANFSIVTNLKPIELVGILAAAGEEAQGGPSHKFDSTTH